jgi:hypothetical protein
VPDFERANRIGEFWGHPESRTFVVLLIDCEEDRTAPACARRQLREGTELPDNGCIASPSIQSAPRRRCRRGRGLATEPM